jgi:hypothetical protein
MSLAKQIGYKRGTEMAVAILQATDEVRAWAELLKSKDENIKLKALIYLSDRAYGKAPQAVEITGEGSLIPIFTNVQLNKSQEPDQTVQ